LTSIIWEDDLPARIVSTRFSCNNSSNVLISFFSSVEENLFITGSKARESKDIFMVNESIVEMRETAKIRFVNENVHFIEIDSPI
jgi:hypothetical protein